MTKGINLTHEFGMSEFKRVHGDKYDYSISIITTSKDPVDITCSRHGVFSQVYRVHAKGSGCPSCSDLWKRREYDPTIASVYGIGFMPTKYKSHDVEDRITKEYNLWSGMMTRAYNPKFHEKKPSYKDITVCENWHHADNFMDWCQKQIGFKSEGFQIDKDILVKGNKVYSPEVCVFVPAEINSQLTKANAKRGLYPIGVSWHSQHEKFMACLRRDKKTKHLGYFHCPTEAFYAYKKAKEDYLKELAEKYKSVIDIRCYEALYNYEVEITD
jgi:hypothetical protein